MKALPAAAGFLCCWLLAAGHVFADQKTMLVASAAAHQARPAAPAAGRPAGLFASAAHFKDMLVASVADQRKLFASLGHGRDKLFATPENRKGRLFSPPGDRSDMLFAPTENHQAMLFAPAEGYTDMMFAPARQGLVIAAMGDIMMGTENLLPADDGLGTFTEVKPYLANCDIVFGNLEGPLTDRGAPTKDTSTGRSFVFRTPPRYIKHLQDAGFNLVSLANNHANDYGPEGRAQTAALLNEAGIKHAGGPGEIAELEVGGVAVAFIALAPNSGCQSLNNIPEAVTLVETAAKKGDLVIVSMHGGGEGSGRTRVPHGTEIYLDENRGDLRELSRRLIDAGADLIIGHGPHVPRGLELYKDRLIAYSLGNFATAAGINVSGLGGVAPLLLVNLDDEGRLMGGQVVSMRQYAAGRPAPDPAGEASRLMFQLSVADFQEPGLANDEGWIY